MNVDPVGFLPPLADIQLPDTQLPGATDQAGPTDFANWIAKEITTTSGKIADSDLLLQRLATGEVDNLHQVMISLQDAQMSFQLLVQVRNKLLEAYQDVLRMQV